MSLLFLKPMVDYVVGNVHEIQISLFESSQEIKVHALLTFEVSA